MTDKPGAIERKLKRKLNGLYEERHRLMDLRFRGYPVTAGEVGAVDRRIRDLEGLLQ